MSMTKNIAPSKLKAVEDVKRLCEEFDTIGLVKVQKIGSKQITDLRSKLRGVATIKMAKKTIMARAFKQVKGKKGLEKLLDYYGANTGPAALIFTNQGALKLRALLDESKTTTRAKVGDVMEKDVLVPAGDTKIPPGPVISELNMAGLPTRIQNGTIHITKDTTILKAGDVVDHKMAMVLARLNLEPVDVVLDLFVAYENGEFLDKEILTLDIESYKDLLKTAYANAMKLSVELGIIVEGNAPLILARAFAKAKALAMELPILIPELLPDYLAKARMQALVLNAAVTGEPLAAPQPAPGGGGPSPTPEPEPEPEQEEEEEEEVGLGDLFG